MTNYTTKTEYTQVDSRLILSDSDYQRPVDHNRVNKIVQAFNENLVNPIKVSFRCGKFYVFDGQHTLAALKARNNNKDLPVSCKVHYGLTKRQEAELFAQQNGLSRSVESIAKFKALYAAGDVDVVDMVNLTSKVGLYIDFGKNRAVNKIVAVSKAYKVYKAAGADGYVKILETIRAAWDGVPESLTAEILGGMCLFHQVYAGQYDDKRLVSKLSKVSPVVIVREGKVSSTPGDTKYARQILAAYNKSLAAHRLADRF